LYTYRGGKAINHKGHKEHKGNIKIKMISIYTELIISDFVAMRSLDGKQSCDMGG
jgi:hypothetical protein